MMHRRAVCIAADEIRIVIIANMHRAATHNYNHIIIVPDSPSMLKMYTYHLFLYDHLFKMQTKKQKKDDI